MELISRFVREQQRYTSEQLREIFVLQQDEFSSFVRQLSNKGILKRVHKTKEEYDLTELIEDDLINDIDYVDSSKILYVFNYVGIIAIGCRIIKVYPKYILSKKEPVLQMKQVIKVLEKYSKSNNQFVGQFKEDGENTSINSLSVILFILRDYYEYGLYDSYYEVLEMNGEGDIVWNRTIDDCFVIIKDNRPYYTELVTRKSVEDEENFFKRLHAWVITDCSRQLSESGLAVLYDMESLNLSEESLDDIGSREYILYRVQCEFNMQFNTRKLLLLKTIYNYIEQRLNLMDKEQGIVLYGTTSFYHVWETVCANVFNDQRKCKLFQLRLSCPIAAAFDPNSTLENIIEHPSWVGKDFSLLASDTLETDTLVVTKYDQEDFFVILDAKYYVLKMEKGKKLRNNPGVGDVTKQYLYQLAFQEFIEAHKIKYVRNCFLMPTEESSIVEKGYVEMKMLSKLKLENIQIRMLPATTIFACYLVNRNIEIKELNLI